MVVFVAAGCGGDGGGGAAGDADGGAPDGGGVLEPAPPAPPEMPRMTPCPDGWREVPDPDLPELVVCDPWPEGGPDECARHEAHFPGGAGCERLGAACPAGDFADDLPEGDSSIYVLAGAPPGGSGAIGSPYGTIAEAVAVARAGTVIALSKGSFVEAETVRVEAAATIWGACVAETIVTSDSGGDAFSLAADGAVVGNLSVIGGRGGITAIGDVQIQSVAIADTASTGIVADVGTVTIREVSLDRTDGVLVFGGHAILDRVVIRRSAGTGLFANWLDTRVEASDVAIRETTTAGPGIPGIASVWVDPGVRMELTRTVVEGCPDIGIAALAGDYYGARWDTQVVARDLVVRDVASTDREGWGIGLLLQGVVAELERVAVDRGTSVGILVQTPPGLLTGTDVVIRDTNASGASSTFGFALQVVEGGSADLRRVACARNRGAGVNVATGASLVAEDLLVYGTSARAGDGGGGVGLVVSEGATTDLVRAEVRANRSTGILVLGAATTLGGEDVAILDTASRELDGDAGEGLEVSGGATVALLRSWLAGNHRGGVLAFHTGTSVTLDEIVVETTGEANCVQDWCAKAAGGCGISSVAAAAIRVSRFRASDNALCGVQVRDADLDLSGGLVSGNPIGANVGSEEFDLGRLLEDVTYRDNDRNLDSISLPVPDPAEPVEGAE